MNDQSGIPCVMMRGGTSRGPFFLAQDLPDDPSLRDEILIAALGAGHPLQIDGIGGGNAVTSKVAIVSRSTRPGADVDYLFAQVSVAKRLVDTSPNCGNMLSAVGPFAIEAGLIPIMDPVTLVRIYNVNTRTMVEAEVQTPGGIVTYGGEAKIDGVPGTAAPVMLSFLDASAQAQDTMFPTGQTLDRIDGIDATCINAAMPMMVLRAADLGVTGHETAAELNANAGLLARLEELRREAGRRMGLGDVSEKVVPKPVLIAPPAGEGDLAVRYFMPATCHPTLATTGAIGLATAGTVSGTLVEQLIGLRTPPSVVVFEHPMGRMDVGMRRRGDRTVASLLRTARRLFEGRILVPAKLGNAQNPFMGTKLEKETPVSA
ncbi:4-oxalomesaconate tautomerase [Neotabrizicola sp. sgz301269]|uniref:4-oxalomesaconate tautomerase n=1 Tax=Neotabrizicola sp. sgz301269 TaxID=3276282 RepID=UPI00376FEB4F